MNEIQIFENEEFGRIRTLLIDGEPWFIGKDVTEILGYAKARNAVTAHVDEEDRTHALIQGGCSTGLQDTLLINESGLYSLILSSKLPGAKAFKRWVTSEILPTIRRTGGTAVSRRIPIRAETIQFGKFLRQQAICSMTLCTHSAHSLNIYFRRV
ncbi:MAG: hypothetical protein E7496_12700 [Ruminococcus sp.]|nr:hypothetical protein [Ruminococcus sp.]